MFRVLFLLLAPITASAQDVTLDWGGGCYASEVSGNGLVTLDKAWNGTNYDVSLSGTLAVTSVGANNVRKALPPGFLPTPGTSGVSCTTQQLAGFGSTSNLPNYGGLGVYPYADTVGGYQDGDLWFPGGLSGVYTLSCAWQTEAPTNVATLDQCPDLYVSSAPPEASLFVPVDNLISASWLHFTPSGNVSIFFGTGPGNGTVNPLVDCGGTNVGLANAQQVGFTIMDSWGRSNRDFTVKAPAGGKYLSFLDVITCRVAGPYLIPDVCPYDNPDDLDADGICESSDVCVGDDATGDYDANGICNDREFLLRSSGTPTAGSQLTLTVERAPANARVDFFGSTTNGVGTTCFGPVCPTIRSPLRLGTATSDALGNASLTVTVPPTVAVGTIIHLQASWYVQPATVGLSNIDDERVR